MEHKNDYLNSITNLYEEQFGQPPTNVSAIAPSGSDRTYVRLISEKGSAIGAYNKNVKENNTYFYFTKIFNQHKLPVPALWQQSNKNMCYLMEDLGTECLLDRLTKEGKTPEVKKLYEKAIEDLVTFQWIAGRDIDYNMCYSTQHFDTKAILADLNYFKYYFLDMLKIDYDKEALQEELERWAKNLDGETIKTFMYRDFQSRNIILGGDKLGYIDFQGGMHGLPHYDLVSLLWQAKAQLPKSWKNHLERHYLKTVNEHKEITDIDELHFMRVYLECVLLRILQTLGAYGFRGIIERKQHFISSIHPALVQLQEYLNDYSHVIRFPELASVLERLIKPNILERFYIPKQNEESKLQVKVYSFSYKKGMPADTTNHGGGFVFDCRGILNPGRFEPYKHLTGRDFPVQEFLQTQTQMNNFMDGIFSTIGFSLKDYLERGFDSLSISFGCTGGQHRSVYAAEQTKKHLKAVYNIDAEILHLEQDPNTHNRR